MIRIYNNNNNIINIIILLYNYLIYRYIMYISILSLRQEGVKNDCPIVPIVPTHPDDAGRRDFKRQTLKLQTSHYTMANVTR